MAWKIVVGHNSADGYASATARIGTGPITSHSDGPRIDSFQVPADVVQGADEAHGLGSVAVDSSAGQTTISATTNCKGQGIATAYAKKWYTTVSANSTALTFKIEDLSLEQVRLPGALQFGEVRITVLNSNQTDSRVFPGSGSERSLLARHLTPGQTRVFPENSLVCYVLSAQARAQDRPTLLNYGSAARSVTIPPDGLEPIADSGIFRLKTLPITVTITMDRSPKHVLMELVAGAVAWR